jgi:hypothetical protein
MAKLDTLLINGGAVEHDRPFSADRQEPQRLVNEACDLELIY